MLKHLHFINSPKICILTSILDQHSIYFYSFFSTNYNLLVHFHLLIFFCTYFMEENLLKVNFPEDGTSPHDLSCFIQNLMFLLLIAKVHASGLSPFNASCLFQMFSCENATYPEFHHLSKSLSMLSNMILCHVNPAW